MDATLKGTPLTKENIEKIFNEILKIDCDDNVVFEIISIKDIRLEDEYGGFRINILAKLDNNKTYITVELTTGDIITPREIKYMYSSIFEDKKIPITSYNLETVISEKFQTIISRGLLNTRLKDFYDIYILVNNKFDDINKEDLLLAIQNTFKKRETKYDFKDIEEIIDEIKDDDNINNLWNEYVLKNPYAKGILFDDTISALKSLNELFIKV